MKRISLILGIALLIGLFMVSLSYGDSTKTVTDGLGRKVKLSGSPERVVTTIVSTTEIALDLGLGNRLVGVPALTKYLSYVPDLQAKAEKKKKIGGFKPSLEKVAALNPDLVIVGASAQKDSISRLKSLGAPIYAAGSKDIADVKESILEIGYLTGTRDRAQKIVGEMVYKEVRLDEAVSGLEEKKKTFYTISKRMYTVGGNTFVGRVLEMAGLNNVFSDLSSYKPVSAEEIIKRNPELIIVTEGSGLSADNLKNEVGLKDVKAVEEGNVMVLSQAEVSMINQPGTKIVDGAINLFEKIYDEEVNL
ncbi:MAG: ABC transporter substrate-binding protein [Candidatus Bipolaricaulia bacterium]